MGVPGNSSVSCSFSIGDSQVPANAHKLICKQTPLADKQMLIFPPLQVNIVIWSPWSVLSRLAGACDSFQKVGSHHSHWSLLFIYSTNTNWAPPLPDSTLVSGDIQQWISCHYGNFIEHSSSSFSTMLASKLQSTMPNERQWCLKFSFAITVKFEVHGAVGRT